MSPEVRGQISQSRLDPFYLSFPGHHTYFYIYLPGLSLSLSVTPPSRPSPPCCTPDEMGRGQSRQMLSSVDIGIKT